MQFLKGTLVTVLGAIVCVAAIAAWFYVSPEPGAGWILFVAFLGSLGLLKSINNVSLNAVAAVAITGAAGAAWFFGQELPHSGWVGFLAILGGLRTFLAINTVVSSNTAVAKPAKK
jgi:hypothetical protein